MTTFLADAMESDKLWLLTLVPVYALIFFGVWFALRNERKK